MAIFCGGAPVPRAVGGASGHYPKIPVATAHANIIAGLCAEQPGLPIVAVCQRLAGSRTFMPHCRTDCRLILMLRSFRSLVCTRDKQIWLDTCLFLATSSQS